MHTCFSNWQKRYILSGQSDLCPAEESRTSGPEDALSQPVDNWNGLLNCHFFKIETCLSFVFVRHKWPIKCYESLIPDITKRLTAILSTLTNTYFLRKKSRHRGWGGGQGE